MKVKVKSALTLNTLYGQYHEGEGLHPLGEPMIRLRSLRHIVRAHLRNWYTRELLRELRSISRDTRIAAARALGDIGDQSALSGLIKALQTYMEDGAVSMSVAEAIVSVGLKTGPPAVPALIEVLKRDWRVHKAAAEALRRIGPPAIPALLEIFGERKPVFEYDVFDRVHWWIGSILVSIGQNMGEPGIPILIEVFKDRNGNLSHEAADALIQIGRPAIPALQGTAPYVPRWWIEECLKKIDEAATSRLEGK